MSAQQVLFDIPGPKAKRRDVIYNVAFSAAILALLAWIAWSAYGRGIFDDRWSVLWDPSRGQTAGDVWYSMLVTGLLLGTLKAVAIAVPVVLPLALVLTIMRVSPRWLPRWIGYIFTHVFRGIPVLLVMYFGVLALDLEPLWAVVLGLVVYNTAVVAEILRAGIAALPSGQREAGLAIGLTPLQTMLRIQLPQAVRIMLPALVSQIVVLLKDTSLGFIIAYVELLTVTKRNYNFFGEPTTVVFVLVAAAIYIPVNMLVSRLAHWLEGRMRRSKHVAERPAGADDAGVTAANRGVSASGNAGPV